MIATHLGFYNTSSSRTHVRFQFSTHAAAGGNVAPLSAFEAADLRIYKATDGAAFSATQRSSASGITMTSPFDTLTGFHDVDIDLTDNTDAGFYVAGSLYSIVLAPDSETIDSQTITGVVLAYFEIGVSTANVTQFGGTAGTFASGRPEVNTSHIAGSAVSTSSAQIGVNVIQLSGDATAADNAESFFDGTGYAGTGNTIPTVTTLTNDPTGVGTLLTRLGTPSNLGGGATVAANLSDIEAQTDDIGVAGAGLTALGDVRLANLDATVSSRSSLDAAGVRSAVGLASANLDTQLDALPTAAETADAVWDEDATGHQTGGTFGQAIGDPGADTNTIFKATVTDATGATVGVDVAAVLADTSTDGVIVATNNDKTNYTVATGGIAAASFAAGAIDAAAIAADAIGSSELADGAITAAKIATGAIDADALAADAVDEIFDELVGDTTVTFRQAVRLFLAALGGKVSGAGTTSITFRNVADDTNRIIATVDADGNRSAITLNL